MPKETARKDSGPLRRWPGSPSKAALARRDAADPRNALRILRGSSLRVRLVLLRPQA